MRLIVGLGNPGIEYERTPHNVGFRVVELLAKKREARWTMLSPLSRTARLSGLDAAILQPQTFMNESGKSVSETLSYLKVNVADLWIVHDDLDLPLGEVRIQYGASSAGHRGVEDIIESIDSKKFWRFRVGIGRPPEGVPPDRYVLMAIPRDMQKNFVLSEQLACDSIVESLISSISSSQKQASKT